MGNFLREFPVVMALVDKFLVDGAEKKPKKALKFTIEI